MITRRHSRLPGVGLGALLLALGFLAGVLSRPLPPDRQRSVVVPTFDRALWIWHDFFTGPQRDSQAAGVAGGTPWAAHIRDMDDALEQNDVHVAMQAWQRAYTAAHGSLRWEGMVEVGDAVLRMGEFAGTPKASEPRARRIYSVALFRARGQRSLDGVIRTAEAFAVLGDQEVVDQSIRIAEALAAQQGDGQAPARLRGFATELAVPGLPGRRPTKLIHETSPSSDE